MPMDVPTMDLPTMRSVLPENAAAGPGFSWANAQADILRLADKQLFFVGGAPRSGTTWLQQSLDRHPDISCAGEGLFMKHFALPLQSMFAEHKNAVAGKNASLFRHTGGYPLPSQQDGDALLGSAILLAMRRQRNAATARAVGEKTPENVFFFPQLQRIFPRGKFIAIARDPRDVLASSWHFFQRPRPNENDAAAKREFLRISMPPMVAGARAMLDFAARHPDRYRHVTYEAMLASPAHHLAALFEFLGVDNNPKLVADIVADTSFTAMTKGRQSGTEERGSFFRIGRAGDWRDTLSEDMNALILRDMEWMFPHFGWTV
jgi:hypothetical protein